MKYPDGISVGWINVKNRARIARSNGDATGYQTSVTQEQISRRCGIAARDLERVGRRYNHQRAAVVPSDVVLVPGVFAATVARDGDYGSQLPVLDPTTLA